MTHPRFLAFDIGAESGRAVIGTLKHGRLLLEEIQRFPNGPVTVCGTMYWNALGLYHNLIEGMRVYAQRFGGSVDSLGIDTWGLDFGLIGKDGSLLQNPVCYRDRRTDGMMQMVCRRMRPESLYNETGIALVPIYTLCQMLSLRLHKSPVLEAADTFLMMPDLLAYFLTGEKRCERSNAISTQLYNPRRRSWSKAVFRAFDLPISIMPKIVDPGTVLGELLVPIKSETGLKRAVVVEPCTHDTASAATAVPGRGNDWAFISSGTWSAVGAFTDKIVPAEKVDVTTILNELSVRDFFVCRNIMGLWLLQQARAVWQRSGQAYSYEELVKLARKAPEGGPMLYPDDPAFLSPDDMCQSIRSYCERSDQKPPRGTGEFARCILESLALSYRHALDQFARILGRRFNVLHIVGGGSRNSLLCQFTANAAGIPVVAGPVEATGAGNVLVQALACGYVGSPTEIRDIIHRSTSLMEYKPKDTLKWQERYGKYLSMMKKIGK